MITLRRSTERHHVRLRRHEAWLTFARKGQGDLPAGGFDGRFDLDEFRLPPGSGLPALPFDGAEVVTYVFEGALASDRPNRGFAVDYAGEFLRRTAERGVRHREMNASENEWAHVFRIAFPAAVAGLPPDLETNRFSSAQRRGALCVVASPDGRNGSLHLRSEAEIYSAVLRPGRYLAHELAPRRGAWLHIVSGAVQMGDVVLSAGDGAGIADEHVVSFFARDESELLLIDLAEPRS